MWGSSRRLIRRIYRSFNPMTLTPTAIQEYDNRAPDSDTTETATFGLGCFWGPDATYGATEGVVRTRVGYAGGSKTDPGYHSLGDHTEVFQVEFDPGVMTYADLLGQAFQGHNPRTQTRKTQYQNVVFAATPAQQEILDEYLQAHGLDADAIETRVEQLSRFYNAEDYHQKYSLRSQQSFISSFEEAGYDDADLRESPIAAKLNGYVAGKEIPTVNELGALEREPVHGD